MISAMIGKIYRLQAMLLELEVYGVIYEINISVNTSSMLSNKKDEENLIFITQIIREDAHLLFGFFDELEKKTFERLIKINGVGPKVALAILSTYTPTSFGKIIQEKDVKALQRVPGIGTKGAGKIMVDLAGFFTELMDDTSKYSVNQDFKNEAFLALQSLGFKTNDISKVLKTLQTLNTQDTIKEALKILK